MLHLVGATLTVLATIGIVIKIGEYLSQHDEEKRRRHDAHEQKKWHKHLEKERQKKEKQSLEAALKRQAQREAEIKRILYGTPIELPLPAAKRPWWKFGNSKIEPASQLVEPIYREDEEELKAQQEFRSKHPFVYIKVPSQHMREFINEFAWLQSKTGNIPSAEDQKKILVGIIKNS